MKKVCKIFMEDDRKGLKELYNITNDELCNIALGWLDMEEMESVHTNEFAMYNDIISYLWDKYKIGEEMNNL